MESKEIKILAVDDNLESLIIMRAMLAVSFPHAIFFNAQSGEKGIELCISENPDVIVLDIGMPVMDGFEVCRRIKSNESIKHIPVLMITSSTEVRESRIKALECGANAFLANPIDESELTAQIRAMVLIKESEERKRDEKERLQELVNEQTRELVEELNRRRKAEEELQLSLENLEKSRLAELNLLEDLQAEIRERQSAEAELVRFFNLVPDLVCIASTNGKFEKINAAWEQTLGFSQEEILNTPLIDQIHPEDRESTIQEISRQVEGNSTVNFINRYRCKDGNYKWLEWMATPAEGGSLLFAAARDISERKQTQDALNQSRKEFQNYFENSSIGMSVTSPDKKWIELNHRLCQMFGYSKKELIGFTWEEITHPEDVAPNNDLFQQAIDGQIDRYEMDKRFIRKNGTILFVTLSVVCQRNEDGTIHHFLSSFVDITERKLAEDALKESEERFQLLFNKAPLGYQSLDFYGNFIEVNQQWLETLGYTQEEVIGKWFGDFLSPDYRDSFRSRFPIFKAKGKIHSEFEMVHKNGNLIFVAFEGRVGYNLNGEFKQTHCILQDITERRRTERALHESEERFRSLYENAPIGIYRTTPDGRILLANPILVKLFGYKSFKELKRRDLNQEENFEPQYSRAKILEKINRDGKMKGLETIMKRKDGSIVFIRESTVLVRDESGNPLYYDGTMEDITERKAAENALKESYEFNNSLLSTLPFGMQIVDEKGNILFIDDKLSNLLGDQAKGKKCWDLYKDDKTQCIDCPLRSGVNIGETNNYESSGVLGGKIFDISHTGMMYKGKKAMLEIFQDITRRKQEEKELIIAKEKAEESDRLKLAFLATMNHELRTPLNHILGFSSLIQAGVTDDDRMDYAATIENSGKNLLSIIEDIFELSLVEQANIKVRKQTFSLLDHFMENKASLDEILHSSGKNEQIELKFKPDPSLLHRYITTDRSKINQVLANLFKNAIKFTHSGTIEFGYKMHDQGSLMFYVKDTGIGISEEKQNIIFDYFRQVDDSHTRLYGGIGIGLAIALKITQVLNGELKVESTPGKGSTFRFTIPVGVSEDRKVVKSEVKPKAELDLTGRTILIVEDDVVSISLIKNYLRNSNVRIIEATDGEKAISKWRLHPEIDLVLMDLKMPGMDGFETTRIFKSEKPELPVIALTAYSLPSDKVKAVKAGCDCIVTKPVDKFLLFAEIKKMLS